MSFNGSGTYVPPAGQPVATGTVIQSATFNTLVTDIGNTFNNVLPRDGQAPMLGQLKITDGTSAVPGIAFNSEASSGMYRPTQGAVALVASGVENLRINSAGRVLIGTTTDDGTNKLQVNGPAKVAGATTLASTLNVTGATSLSSVTTSGAATVGTTLGVTGASNFTGSVGIGATASTPINGAKLTLTHADTAGVASIGIRNDTAAGSAAFVAQDDTKAKYCEIGVLNSATTNPTTYGLAGEGYARASANAAGLHLSSANSAGYIRKSINGNEVLRVTATGNLGLGTSSPVSKLHVASGDVIVANGGNVANAGGSLYFCAVNSSSAPMAAIKGALDWSNTTEEQGKLLFLTRTTTGAAGSALVERMRIENNGNVGIGVAAPTAKLHVLGTVAATSDASFGSVSVVTAPSAGAYNNIVTGGDALYKGTSTSVPVSVAMHNGSAIRLNSSTIQFRSNNAPTDSMQLDASGALNINGLQTGSTYKLYVNGYPSFGNTGSGFDVLDLNSTNGASLRLQAAGNSSTVGIGSTGAQPLLFMTNNAERARIEPPRLSWRPVSVSQAGMA